MMDAKNWIATMFMFIIFFAAILFCALLIYDSRKKLNKGDGDLEKIQEAVVVDDKNKVIKAKKPKDPTQPSKIFFVMLVAGSFLCVICALVSLVVAM